MNIKTLTIAVSLAALTLTGCPAPKKTGAPAKTTPAASAPADATPAASAAASAAEKTGE
tara:strand:- start:230 stop:406 length:177 start_codon:yes stop_codon:yes gene_type:complete